LHMQANHANVFARGGFARRRDLSLKRIKRLEGRLSKRTGKLLSLGETRATGTV
jgi:hypothetical protein